MYILYIGKHCHSAWSDCKSALIQAEALLDYGYINIMIQYDYLASYPNGKIFLTI